MGVDKVRGSNDNSEPERKGEKKLRDVGSQFKEIEKTGAIDPDNRKRKREYAPLMDENTTQRKLNDAPPLTSKDNRGPITPSVGAKPFPKNRPASPPQSSGYIPSTPSQNDDSTAPSFEPENNTAPTDNKEQPEPTQAESKEKEKGKGKEKVPTTFQEVDLAPLKAEKPAKMPAAPNETAPLKPVHAEKEKEPEKLPSHKVAAKKEEAPHNAPAPKKEESPKTEKKEPAAPQSAPEPKKPGKEHEKKTQEKAQPLLGSESAQVHHLGGAHNPTIIVGAAAPAPPPLRSGLSSQLSHPEVARLFEQMVSHMTAISQKGVKEVSITLSTGTFRGSQIIIRETSTALRHYNVELRGLTKEAQDLFSQNAGELMQFFSKQKYSFTIHRLETRPLIERKEDIAREKEDNDENKEE